MKELEAIKERAEKATPGPWEVYDPNEGTGHSPLWCVANEAFHNPPADEEAEWLGVEIYVGDKEDAEFIAHSPADMAKLIGALEAVLNLANHEPRFRPRMFDGEPFPIQVSADEIIEAITEALA